MTTLNKPDTVPADLRKEFEQTFGFVPSFALTTTPLGLRLWWQGICAETPSPMSSLVLGSSAVLSDSWKSRTPDHHSRSPSGVVVSANDGTKPNVCSNSFRRSAGTVSGLLRVVIGHPQGHATVGGIRLGMAGAAGGRTCPAIGV